jgi:gas vesicle protein
MDSTEKILIAFLAGATAGALSALLLAPDTGENTRKKLNKAADDFGHSLTETLESSAEKVKEIADSALSEAEKYIKKTSESTKKS